MKYSAPATQQAKKRHRKRGIRTKSRMEVTLGPAIQPATSQKNPIEKKKSKKYQVLDQLKTARTELMKATKLT